MHTKRRVPVWCNVDIFCVNSQHANNSWLIQGLVGQQQQTAPTHGSFEYLFVEKSLFYNVILSSSFCLDCRILVSNSCQSPEWQRSFCTPLQVLCCCMQWLTLSKWLMHCVSNVDEEQVPTCSFCWRFLFSHLTLSKYSHIQCWYTIMWEHPCTHIATIIFLLAALICFFSPNLSTIACNVGTTWHEQLHCTVKQTVKIIFCTVTA